MLFNLQQRNMLLLFLSYFIPICGYNIYTQYYLFVLNPSPGTTISIPLLGTFFIDIAIRSFIAAAFCAFCWLTQPKILMMVLTPIAFYAAVILIYLCQAPQEISVWGSLSQSYFLYLEQTLKSNAIQTLALIVLSCSTLLIVILQCFHIDSINLTKTNIDDEKPSKFRLFLSFSIIYAIIVLIIFSIALLVLGAPFKILPTFAMNFLSLSIILFIICNAALISLLWGFCQNSTLFKVTIILLTNFSFYEFFRMKLDITFLFEFATIDLGFFFVLLPNLALLWYFNHKNKQQ